MPRKKGLKGSAPNVRRSARIAEQKGKKKRNNDQMEVEQQPQPPPPPPPPPSSQLEKEKNSGKDDTNGLESKVDDIDMAGNNGNKGDPGKVPPPQPPSPPTIPDDAHPDADMRAVAEEYLGVRREYRAELAQRRVIQDQMVNWTDEAIMKWVRAYLPSAERAVGIMFGPELKRRSLWSCFSRHHGRILNMVDNMRDSLIKEGFDENLFKELDDDVKDDSGRERKDDNDRNGDSVSVTASQDRYHPDQELAGGSRDRAGGLGGTAGGRRRRARVRIGIRDPGNGGAAHPNSNSNSNGAPDDDKDDADIVLDKEVEKMKAAMAAKDAENKALLKKVKELEEKKNGNLEIDGNVKRKIDKIMNKKRNKKGSDVSYSDA